MTLPLNPPTAANPAIAMGVVFFFFRTSQEPEYQGRSLSSWLTQLDNWDGLDTNAPVVFAVRAIGSNAVPLIVGVASQQLTISA